MFSRLTHRIFHNKVFDRSAILLLIALAFGLRAWGTNFGLPDYVYHPDEPAIVERAAAIMRTGDFNPRWFHYPSGYIYLQAASYIVYFLYSAAGGNLAFVPEYTLPQFYLVGRLTTAVLGSLTVLIVYLIGLTGFSKRIGLVAAILQLGSYLSVVHSHYATTDVPATLWVALSTLFALLILQRLQPSWYILAGFFAGVATTTKYNAGLVFLLLPFAHFLGTPREKWGYLSRTLTLGSLATAVGFFVGTPYSLFDLPTFLNGIGFELNHYNTSQIGYTGNSALWYVSSLFTSADAPLALAYGAGFLFAIARPSRMKMLLLAFPALYLVGLARTPVHFERNLLPSIPALSVLAAVTLDYVAVFTSSHFKQLSQNIFLFGLTLTVIIVPGITSLLFDTAITQPDARSQAGVWVSENIPSGSKLAIEHYSIPFPRDRYEVTDILRLWDHQSNWYEQEGFDYIIISNGIWLTLFKDANNYSAEVKAFYDVTSDYQIVAAFAPKDVPVLVTAGYSTILEYHFPHVWIIRVNPNAP